MPFTDSDLRALKPQAKQFRVATGNGLFVVVYPNGGKYFVWGIASHLVVVVSRGGTTSVRMDVVQGNGLSRQHGMRRIVWTFRGRKGKTPGQFKANDF